jgi:hypothetical protein
MQKLDLEKSVAFFSLANIQKMTFINIQNSNENP